MQTILDTLNRWLTGPVMVWGVLFVGLWMALQTRLLPFRRFFYALRYTVSQMFQKPQQGQKGITPSQAVTTALSGTLGTGNIAGVGAAISIGGPGALFWMWVGAFLGMATKYSEITLAMRFRRKGKDGKWLGGPMYYLEQIPGGKKTACFFAVFCLAASFFSGNMVQSNTAAAAVRSVTSLSPGMTGLLFAVIALLIGLVIIGGIGRIAKTTELLVPAMALFYIAGCLIVLFTNRNSLPHVFSLIFSEAFSLKSAAGGVSGCLMMRAMKVGFTRGVFTNEAGLGSAPIAHAAAENSLPARQGLWGIFEVFTDTIVMCSLTGFVVILSGFYQSGSSDGAAVTLAAFEHYLGGFAACLTGVSTVFFAVASIIGWCYYGESCVRYLSGSGRLVLLYKALYVIAVYAGAVLSVDVIWGLTDICNGLMMLPNLIGVAFLSHVVRQETKQLDAQILASRKPRSRRRMPHRDPPKTPWAE